jgi:hypothetical protein
LYPTNFWATNAAGITNAVGTNFAPLAHVSATNNPHAVTASQVGLGAVENTALSTWTGSTNIHTLGSITNGPTTLSGYGITDATLAARTISTTAPLAGGGDLTANRTLTVDAATTNAPGVIQIATDIEIQTGTDSGKSAPPSGLAAWWTWLKTQAQTFAGVMTFSSGVTMTEQTIASSDTPAWNVNAGMNAQFTATNAATFSITNMVAGQAAALAITQASGTNGYVMTFPAGTKQAFGGNNTYTMSGTNAVDILYFRRTGTNTVIEGVVPGITP